MPTIDDRTSTQSYAKPNVANTLQADVVRLRSALDDIDGDMANALRGGVITDLTDIGAALADGDLFTVYDLSATTNRKAAATRITDYTFGKISGDVTVTSGGVAAIGTGVIVNADVNASAAIAGTKVSPDFGSQNVITTGSSTAAQFVPTSATVPTNGLYLPAANTVGIATGSSERFRVDPTGQVGIGATPGAGFSFVVGSQITGGTAAQGITSQGTVQSGVTSAASYFRANISTAAASFTCTNVRGYYAFFSSLGASSVITNLYGFFADSGLTQGTNNFGFYSNISAAAGRWNFYANGTAENYFANNVKIGGTADRATTAGTNQLVIFNGTAPVGTLTNGISFYSTAGECRVMDSSGNATLLSPHDAETNEWIYDSTHTPTGRRLRVDMEKLVKFLDAHFGLGFVQETFVTP